MNSSPSHIDTPNATNGRQPGGARPAGGTQYSKREGAAVWMINCLRKLQNHSPSMETNMEFGVAVRAWL